MIVVVMMMLMMVMLVVVMMMPGDNGDIYYDEVSVCLSVTKTIHNPPVQLQGFQGSRFFTVQGQFLWVFKDPGWFFKVPG